MKPTKKGSMKVKDLIKLIKDYPDFELTTSLFLSDNSEYGAGLQSFKITGINDIGYSDKVIDLDNKKEV